MPDSEPKRTQLQTELTGGRRKLGTIYSVAGAVSTSQCNCKKMADLVNSKVSHFDRHAYFSSREYPTLRHLARSLPQALRFAVIQHSVFRCFLSFTFSSWDGRESIDFSLANKSLNAFWCVLQIQITANSGFIEVSLLSKRPNTQTLSKARKSSKIRLFGPGHRILGQ